MADNEDIRLSAVRAFLGRITPDIRLIGCTKAGQKITVRIIMDAEPDEATIEMISDAATEIVADFPNATLKEDISINQGPLPREDLIQNGHIFMRSES